MCGWVVFKNFIQVYIWNKLQQKSVSCLFTKMGINKFCNRQIKHNGTKKIWVMDTCCDGNVASTTRIICFSLMKYKPFHYKRSQKIQQVIYDMQYSNQIHYKLDLYYASNYLSTIFLRKQYFLITAMKCVILNIMNRECKVVCNNIFFLYYCLENHDETSQFEVATPYQ